MNQEDFEVVRAMEVWGGGFVKALAIACKHADDDNLAKIKKAFPAYWSNYAKMAATERQANGPRWYDFGKP